MINTCSLSNLKTKISYLEIPDFLSNNYIPTLNGWRAVAIIFVILGHFKLTLESGTIVHTILNHTIIASFGVRIFFVLSGFLITTLLIKEYLKTKTINLKNFFFRRILRLYPLLVFYLLTIFIINEIFKLELYPIHFMAPLLYVTNFSLENNWLTGHTWSLSVEEQFYLLWPFLFKFSKSPIVVLFIIIFIIIPIIIILNHYEPQLNKIILFPFFIYAQSIFVGSLISFLICIKAFSKYLNQILKLRLVLNFGLILIIYSIYYLTIRELINIGFNIASFLLVDFMIGYLLLTSVYNFERRIIKILEWPVFVFIGKMSYSLYMWQQLFLLPKDDFPALENFIIFPLNIILTFFTAYISYKYFESYFLRFKENWKTI